jgi:hypothetical protein
VCGRAAVSASPFRPFVWLSVGRLRGELTGSRSCATPPRRRRFAPAALGRAAPVPPFATARSGRDSAAVVLPPETPAPAGFLAHSGSAWVVPGAPRAATLVAPAAVAELVDAQASGACELYARGGSSPLSRTVSLGACGAGRESSGTRRPPPGGLPVDSVDGRRVPRCGDHPAPGDPAVLRRRPTTTARHAISATAAAAPSGAFGTPPPASGRAGAGARVTVKVSQL